MTVRCEPFGMRKKIQMAVLCYRYIIRTINDETDYVKAGNRWRWLKRANLLFCRLVV